MDISTALIHALLFLTSIHSTHIQQPHNHMKRPMHEKTIKHCILRKTNGFYSVYEKLILSNLSFQSHPIVAHGFLI